MRSSDAIQGTLTATLEQGVLGCHCGSNPGGTCDMAPCGSAEVNISKTINPVITQNAMPSTFRAVRVDAALTCAQLVAMRDTIFPR